MADIVRYRSDLPSFLDEFNAPVNVTEPEKAFALYQMLLQAKRNQDYLFLGIGKLLKEIKDNELYRQLDYESFNEFVTSDELGFSRESAFLYVRVYEYYIERLKLDAEYVGKINLARLGQMLPLLKKLDNPEKEIEMVEEFSNLRQSDFMLKLRQGRGDDKPTVHYSKELGKWLVEYYTNRTELRDLGNFEDYMAR